MSTSEVREKILREMRESPVKAGLLGLGVLVAVAIWGPRLAGAFEDAPSSQAAMSQTAEGLESGVPTRRNPNAIRAEFVRISEDAMKLRQMARRILPRPVVVQPFAEKAHVTKSSVVASLPLNGGEEVIRVGGLVLSGIVEFAAGRSALMSGEVLRKGDTYQGFLVLEIESRAVVLRGSQGDYRIEMKTGEGY